METFNTWSLATCGRYRAACTIAAHLATRETTWLPLSTSLQKWATTSLCYITQFGIFASIACGQQVEVILCPQHEATESIQNALILIPVSWWLMLKPRPPDANTENEIDDTEDHHFKAKLKKEWSAHWRNGQSKYENFLSLFTTRRGKEADSPFTINQGWDCELWPFQKCPCCEAKQKLYGSFATSFRCRLHPSHETACDTQNGRFYDGQNSKFHPRVRMRQCSSLHTWP